MDQTSHTHKRDISYSSDEGHPWEEAARFDNEVYQSAPVKTPALAWGEFLYGKPLNWYWKVIVWPMFILLVAEIGLRVMHTRYFPTASSQLMEWLIGGIRLGVFSYLTISGIKQFLAFKRQILAAAVLSGLLAGIILAIFQLFWYFELWVIFNLLGQPLLLAFEGLIVSWLICLFFGKNLKIKQ